MGRVVVMPILYEVATLNAAFSDRPYALVRVDTDKKAGAGLEGVVVSTHVTRQEADEAASLASKTAGRA